MKTLNKVKSVLLTVLFLVVILVQDSSAQYQIRNYDLRCGLISGADFGRSIINRLDNGYAIAGYSYASGCGIGPFDWMLLRINSSGIHQGARLFGTLYDDKCYSVVQQRNDSGYVMSGYMFDISRSKTKATMLKTRKDGATVMYGKWINDTLASSYQQDVIDQSDLTANAGWGERKIGTKQVKKILVSQYSPAGILNWAYRYDSWSSATTVSKSNDEAFSLCYQMAGGQSYGVTARTDYYSGAVGKYDIMVIKLSYTGNVIWRKVYRFVPPSSTYFPSAEPRKIIPMTDGGFVVVGTTNAYVQNETDIIVFRVNSSGNLMWSYTYGNTGFLETGNSIVADGNQLVITGDRKRSTTAPDALMLFIPIAGGAPIRTMIWDPATASETGYDIIRSNVSAPSGYAVTGDASFNSTNPFLWRTNSIGIVSGTDCNDSIIVQHKTNTHKLDSFNIVKVKMNDKEFMPSVAGPSIVTNTNCLGTATVNPQTGTDDPLSSENTVNEVTSYSLSQNYPNPFNPSTIIEYAIPVEGNVSIRIYDAAGKEIYSLVNSFKTRGIHKTEFNAGSLSNGVYYYKLTSGNFTDVKKMILIK